MVRDYSEVSHSHSSPSRPVQILPDRIMAASTVIYDFVDGSHTEMKAFAILYKGLDVRHTVLPVRPRAHSYDPGRESSPIRYIWRFRFS